MSINLFNDTDNDFLFVDAQLLFRKTFISKNSDLLKTILSKYTTANSELLKVWNAVKNGDEIPLTPDNAKCIAWIFSLCSMLVEARNYIVLKNISESEIPKFEESLQSPRLSEKQSEFFKENILESLADNRFNQILSRIQKLFKRISPQKSITDTPEFKYRFPNFDKDYFVGALPLGDSICIAEISTNEGTITPKGTFSVNTLVFPTTVAPILASNREQGSVKESLVIDIKRNANHFAYTNRISNSGSISKDSKIRLFEGAEALYKDALAKGNDGVQDLIASAQSELDNAVRSLSNDKNSSYYGMAPDDIKAGLLSKILGTSKGYNQFAYDVEDAIESAVNTIDLSNVVADVAISQWESSDKTPTSLDKLNEIIDVQNITILEATGNTLELLNCVKPILTIDEDALLKRGFAVEPKQIYARSNDGGISLVAGGVSLSVSLGAMALIVVSAMLIVQNIKTGNARKKKEALESLKETNKWLKSQLDYLKEAAVAGNMVAIKSNLDTLADKTIPTLTNFYRSVEDYKSDISFTPEVIKLESIQKNLKKIIIHEPLTIEFIQKSLNIQTKLTQNNIDSLNETIDLQTKRIEDLEKYDFVGSVFKLGVDTADNLNTILRYAGYIALGMASIWGGVKVYRSLNDE